MSKTPLLLTTYLRYSCENSTSIYLVQGVLGFRWGYKSSGEVKVPEVEDTVMLLISGVILSLSMMRVVEHGLDNEPDKMRSVLQLRRPYSDSLMYMPC